MDSPVPKPKPHIFDSRTQCIAALQAESTRALAKSFFANRSATIACVTEQGVGGNTFRAFRNLPVRPSVAFRTWTSLHLSQTLPELLRIADGAAYASYIHESTLALNRHWQQETRSEMGYGRGAKLLNLVLKKLVCYAELTDQQRERLIPLLHVPLDSFTIVGLQRVDPALQIPKNATMKYITTPRQYTEFQALIADLASQAGVPPIEYDILAWDLAH